MLATALVTDMTGLLFLSSGIAKMRDVPRFASVIATYRLSPLGAAFPLAHVLAILQVIIGIWLCSGFEPFPATLATCALLIIFSAAIGINLSRNNKHLSCGCIPGSAETLSWVAVIRNLLLIISLLAVSTLTRPKNFLLSAEILCLSASLLLLLLAASHLKRRDFA